MMLLKLVCLASPSLRSFALHCTDVNQKETVLPQPVLCSASGMDNVQDKEMCPVDEASGQK